MVEILLSSNDHHRQQGVVVFDCGLTAASGIINLIIFTWFHLRVIYWTAAGKLPLEGEEVIKLIMLFAF